MEFKNQYLTYDEYKKIGGQLQEMPFNLLEYRARKQVDLLTFNRFTDIDDYPQELKLCVNELISELHNYNDVGNKSSESVGSYSISFNKPVTTEEKQVLENIIVTYLSEIKVNDVPVLYRGADTNDN